MHVIIATVLRKHKTAKDMWSLC